MIRLNFSGISNLAASANKDWRLPIVIGKDEKDQIYVEDLRNLRNILVGGATAQGKTEFLRSVLTSLIIQKSCDELKVAMIDLKGCELDEVYDEESEHSYHGLPRATSLDEASLILNALNGEIETRLNLLKSAGVRRIEDYNEQLQENETRIPYIVLAIDELAELLIPGGDDMTRNLRQLLSKCYVTGIYVIATTTRPYIIPGIIKPDLPTRICFRCLLDIDSKGIIDRPGAEKLTSQGELLFDNNADGLGLRKLKAPKISYAMKGPDALFWWKDQDISK